MCLPPEEKEDENMRKTISLFSKDTLHRIPFTPLSLSRGVNMLMLKMAGYSSLCPCMPY